MSRIAFVNGRYLPQAEAMIPMEDRGNQFGDSVYEVIEYLNRVPVDMAPHLERLDKSLAMMGIGLPAGRNVWEHQIKQVIARNSRRHGGIYLQVSRGAAARDHLPRQGMVPTVCISSIARRTPSAEKYQRGIRTMLLGDIRWQRCQIKSTMLAGAVQLKQYAVDAGYDDAVFYDHQDRITESSSSNVFFVDKTGALVTPPLEGNLLPGVARMRVIEFAREMGIKVQEREIHRAEASEMREAFLTSSLLHCLPVVQVGDAIYGEGCGDVTRALIHRYHDYLFALTGETCPKP